MSNNESGRGNRQPPKHAQYQKGISGNPLGRPKRSKRLGVDLLNEKLNKAVERAENGQTVKLCGRRALIRSEIEQGLRCNVKAIRRVFRKSRASGLDKPKVQFIIENFGSAKRPVKDGSDRFTK